jgi:uncharacterized protein (DUF983 family)
MYASLLCSVCAAVGVDLGHDDLDDGDLTLWSVLICIYIYIYIYIHTHTHTYFTLWNVLVSVCMCMVSCLRLSWPGKKES